MEYLVMGPLRIRSSTEPAASVIVRRTDVNLCRGILSRWIEVCYRPALTALFSNLPHQDTPCWAIAALLVQNDCQPGMYLSAFSKLCPIKYLQMATTCNKLLPPSHRATKSAKDILS